MARSPRASQHRSSTDPASGLCSRATCDAGADRRWDAPPAGIESEAIQAKIGMPEAEHSQGKSDAARSKATRSKATRSKATRSKADDARRPNLEGPEQAPA